MKIIIVDDDQLVTNALKTILQVTGKVEVLATGCNGLEAIALYQKYHPDIILMDIQMKEMSGLDAAREILKEAPHANILLLTTFSDNGYLLKQDYESILPALEAVNSGQTVFGSEIVSKLPDLFQKKNDFSYANYDITEREEEVIQLIAQGLSNKEIATTLFLSEGTVRNYLSSILDKLGLRDRTQVAIFYYQHK